MTKFGIVIQVAEKRVSKMSAHAPIPKRRGSTVPNVLHKYKKQ